MFKIYTIKTLKNSSFYYFSNNHYELLGISKTSSVLEIRNAYLNKVKQYHPDKNSLESSLEHFKEIQKAYEILKDSEKRSEYDDSLNFSQKADFYANERNYRDFYENPKKSKEEEFNDEYEYYKKKQKNEYNFHNYQNFYNRKYSKYEEKVLKEQDIFYNQLFLAACLTFACFFYLFNRIFIKNEKHIEIADFHKPQDPFENYTPMPNINPEFENFTGVVFNRRIPSDSEAIRIKLIENELKKKNVTIELGSNDIYVKGRINGKRKKIEALKSVENKNKGIFKSTDIDVKGKKLSVNQYRERFLKYEQ